MSVGAKRNSGVVSAAADEESLFSPERIKRARTRAIITPLIEVADKLRQEILARLAEPRPEVHRPVLVTDDLRTFIEGILAERPNLTRLSVDGLAQRVKSELVTVRLALTIASGAWRQSELDGAHARLSTVALRSVGFSRILSAVSVLRDFGGSPYNYTGEDALSLVRDLPLSRLVEIFGLNQMVSDASVAGVSPLHQLLKFQLNSSTVFLLEALASPKDWIHCWLLFERFNQAYADCSVVTYAPAVATRLTVLEYMMGLARDRIHSGFCMYL